MRSVYKYNSTIAWKKYHDEKAKGFPYSGQAAFYLNDGCHERPRQNKRDEAGFCFALYWIALELIHEGKGDSLNLTLEEILAKCKKNYKDELKRLEEFKREPDTYKGYELNWETYKPDNECYNSFDCWTGKCELPVKLSDEECKELHDGLWEHFHDPICDGRDCTGAWFTTSIRFFRAPQKTIILHEKQCDM